MSKTTSIGANMMLVSTPFRNVPSFSLIPVTNDCPYVEGLYDPTSGILAVIGKTTKQSFHMVPRLDDNGNPQRLKIPNNETGKTVKEQRVSMDTFSEFYISDKKEIEDFISIFSINATSYDYNQFMVDVGNTEEDKSPLITTV